MKRDQLELMNADYYATFSGSSCNPLILIDLEAATFKDLFHAASECLRIINGGGYADLLEVMQHTAPGIGLTNIKIEIIKRYKRAAPYDRLS